MALESIIFKQKSPHKFSDTDPSTLIVSRFTHFEQPFSLQNQKTTYSTTLSMALSKKGIVASPARRPPFYEIGYAPSVAFLKLI